MCLICNPQYRLGSRGIQELLLHPWFAGINWDALRAQRIAAPFLPDMQRLNTNVTERDLRALLAADLDEQASQPLSDEDQACFAGFDFVRGVTPVQPPYSILSSLGPSISWTSPNLLLFCK